jgi:hypothetical protein
MSGRGQQEGIGMNEFNYWIVVSNGGVVVEWESFSNISPVFASRIWSGPFLTSCLFV